MPSRFAIALAALLTFAGAPEAMAAATKPPNLVEADVATLQAAMQRGRTTSADLVRGYLARIKAIDRAGPRLHSVVEINPEALAIAKALDRERREQGPRGPLHGIPVLLKDNIATADSMQTSAGSLALLGAIPVRDAAVVAKLRAAGVVILGKTNLSEWANFRSTRSTSGWSARGGLTRNPYALDRNTSGSSSGSAAAIAASLAAIAVGTETDGSITSPAAINGLVGIKPTVGLVSRAGIVPIAASQDTAGPMARTVADAAALLAAMAGGDPRDAATSQADAKAADYTKHLDAGALRGARIGVVRSQLALPRQDLVAPVFERAVEAMRAQGATIVDLPELPGAGRYGATELEVLLYEFKAGVAEYLRDYAPHAKVKTLADLIDFNEANHGKELKWFGQELFVRAQAKGGLDSPEYREALAHNHRWSRAEGIDKALAGHRLDALVAPSNQPAWLTDFVKGDASGGGFAQAAAVSGYPHVTVPAGFVEGLPVGISFVGGAWSEARLVALAYAYEQATKARRAPKYRKTANAW